MRYKNVKQANALLISIRLNCKRFNKARARASNNAFSNNCDSCITNQLAENNLKKSAGIKKDMGPTGVPKSVNGI